MRQRTDVLAQLVQLPETVEIALLGHNGNIPVSRRAFLSALLLQMDQNSLPIFYFLMKQPAEMFLDRRSKLDKLLMRGHPGMLKVLLQIPEDEFMHRSYSLHHLLAYRSFTDPELLAELLELTPHSIIYDRQGARDKLMRQRAFWDDLDP
jgi:hypothetical protein